MTVRHHVRPSLAGLALCFALGIGCGSGGGGEGTGGSPQGGSGGTTGWGGTTASGGMIGSAGTTGSGGNSGTTGSGGVTASGGTTGAAGTFGSGGTSEGGTVGTGGSTSGAGGRGGAGLAGRGGTTGAAGRGGAGAAGTAGAGGGGGGAGAAGTGGSAGGAAMMSAGCGKPPTLKSSPSTTTFNYNTLTSGGASRRYILRLPTNYDNGHPYRLILGFHGATNNATNVAGNPAYFGIYDRSNGSTIFIAPEAVGGIWSSTTDVTFVDDILKQVEADLCIDTTRVELEGFSQGGAMAYTLACARPNVFRAAVVHSGGGLSLPTTCQPIAYFSSLGQQENTQGQTMTSDFFAKADGCTIETLPKAPTGGHLCSDYKGCSAGHSVRWCPYDGGHTPSPTDSGQGTSWMPGEVWTFLSQF